MSMFAPSSQDVLLKEAEDVLGGDVKERGESLLAQYQEQHCKKTDQLFGILFLFQWVLEIAFALLVTPRTWIGETSLVHVHVWIALFLGLIIIAPSCHLIIKRPGKIETRYAIAITQALTSVLLIHLTGGRIETHFHVFGSLAFLSIYREWQLLLAMTIIITADHLLGGWLWPQSVYGVITGNEWRWLEHGAWLVFENVFLIQSCLQSRKEMHSIVEQQVQLSEMNRTLDEKVVQRTEELARLQAELLQADKMISLGQLAAGMAHEVNNPIGFVMSNMSTLDKYVKRIKDVLSSCLQFMDKFQKENPTSRYEADIQQIRLLEAQSRLPLILKDIDSLLLESMEGVARVKIIVQSLKNFAQLDKPSLQLFNINTGIQDTLTIVWNDLKDKCNVQLDLGDIPMIHCNPGQLNQVFLNLIMNAAHAISEQGNIFITTKACDSHILMSIQDTGEGISPEILGRIFDPFFTTRPVGQGTGLGLASSYGIITKHQGSLSVESEVGKGATFTIRLPV